MFIFFSSRRRHTRYWRDWSSDVCSSDLDEFAYALFHQKLWGVHLNDQNGLKYDQDKTFGSVDLRRAFNQVDTLVRHGYGRQGEVVGLDVKAMRTQPFDKAHLHLKHSKEIFLMLVELAHRIDRKAWQGYVDA